MGGRRGDVTAEVLAYRPTRHYYPLLPSTRPAIACVQLQLGQGNDLGELIYALKLLKKRIARDGYFYAMKRARLPTKRARRRFKVTVARRRMHKAAARARAYDNRGEGAA